MNPTTTSVAPTNNPFVERRIVLRENIINGTMTPTMISSQYMYVSRRGTKSKESIFRSARSTNFITAYTPSIITQTRAISVSKFSSNPRLNALLLRNDSKIIIPHPAAIADV